MKIKIQTTDAEECQYVQQTLVEIIHTLSQSENNHQEHIYWLSKILLSSYE